jgi:hypothetical protein
MSEKIYLPWSDPRPYWSGGPPGTIDFIWSEVYILVEVGNAIGGAGGFIPDEEPWKWLENKVDKKVVDQFRKIVIRVNNLEKTKEPDKEIKVTAHHIKSTLNQFGINVNVETRPVSQKKNRIDVGVSRPSEIIKKNISVSVDVKSSPSTQADI